MGDVVEVTVGIGVGLTSVKPSPPCLIGIDKLFLCSVVMNPPTQHVLLSLSYAPTYTFFSVNREKSLPYASLPASSIAKTEMLVFDCLEK